MVIEFDPAHPGTAQQQEWFNYAVFTACTFAWDRIDTVVTVGFYADPSSAQHNEFAVTLWNYDETDNCGRPSRASIRMKDDLDDPDRDGTFSGRTFFNDVVVHEMAHVVQGKLSPQQIEDICAAFESDTTHWLAGLGDEDLWADRISESWAETFKDIYLPKSQRKFDNRTNTKLKRAHFNQLLSVIDGVCPCAHGGDA